MYSCWVAVPLIFFYGSLVRSYGLQIELTYMITLLTKIFLTMTPQIFILLTACHRTIGVETTMNTAASLFA